MLDVSKTSVTLNLIFVRQLARQSEIVTMGPLVRYLVGHIVHQLSIFAKRLVLANPIKLQRFPIKQHQDAETLIFLLLFTLVSLCKAFLRVEEL